MSTIATSDTLNTIACVLAAIFFGGSAGIITIICYMNRRSVQESRRIAAALKRHVNQITSN